jgi:glutamate--cysteine ligase
VRAPVIDLASVFAGSPETGERIGLELECGLVDSRTGLSAPYAGPSGAGALLRAVIAEYGAAPVTDAGHLTGARLPGGAEFTLELGGALEYSSRPLASLAELVRETRRDLRAAADLAARFRLAVLPGGLLPFTPTDRIPWIPKPRIPVMREYFRELGPAAAEAEGVMGLSLSAQTHLDYLSEADFAEKFRLLVLAAPVASAMFVNSPLQHGEPTGFLSCRMRMWQRVDPARCGVLGFAVRPEPSVGDLIEWALRLPMIYRAGRRAPDRTFAELLRDGYGDGDWPGPADWLSHLSQTWPDVRVRQTLELRAADGPSWPDFAAAPAFWAGLAYHPPARRAALALLDGITAAELAAATGDVARRGLAARVGRRPVGELAAGLLDLARTGLRERVAAGWEPPEVVGYLDPLAEVVRTGVTFAERYLRDWTGPLRQRPDALVRAYQVAG